MYDVAEGEHLRIRAVHIVMMLAGVFVITGGCVLAGYIRDARVMDAAQIACHGQAQQVLANMHRYPNPYTKFAGPMLGTDVGFSFADCVQEYIDASDAR